MDLESFSSSPWNRSKMTASERPTMSTVVKEMEIVLQNDGMDTSSTSASSSITNFGAMKSTPLHLMLHWEKRLLLIVTSLSTVGTIWCQRTQSPNSGSFVIVFPILANFGIRFRAVQTIPYKICCNRI